MGNLAMVELGENYLQGIFNRIKLDFITHDVSLKIDWYGKFHEKQKQMCRLQFSSCTIAYSQIAYNGAIIDFCIKGINASIAMDMFINEYFSKIVEEND